jgi:tetratricopeptide (TPR) repeat protein
MARRDVHIDYYKVARLQSALGDYRNALFNQKKSVELCEAEVKANPASSEARADLGVAYFRLAEILENTGKLTEALENYKKALTIEENASNADPTNTDLLGNLAEDYMKVGDISLKLGDHESALKSYLKSLKINQDLAAASPESQENKTSLALVFDSLGAYYALLAKNNKQTENWQEAKNYYQQSLNIWQELEESDKLATEYANKTKEIKQNLEKCELALTKPQR